jgi:hypothetical protein
VNPVIRKSILLSLLSFPAFCLPLLAESEELTEQQLQQKQQEQEQLQDKKRVNLFNSIYRELAAHFPQYQFRMIERGRAGWSQNKPLHMLEMLMTAPNSAIVMNCDIGIVENSEGEYSLAHISFTNSNADDVIARLKNKEDKSLVDDRLKYIIFKGFPGWRFDCNSTSPSFYYPQEKRTENWNGEFDSNFNMKLELTVEKKLVDGRPVEVFNQVRINEMKF